MAFRIRPVNSTSGAENDGANIKAKNASNPISHRSALGEIGNKVGPKKHALKDVKPANLIKPHTLSVKGKVSTVTTAAQKQVKCNEKLNSKIPVHCDQKCLVKPFVKHTVISNLPPNVENIDEDGDENVFLVSEYVNDVYKYLLELEVKYPVREKYLTNSEISSRMRATLVDWLVDVQMQYHLLHETLHIAVGIMDRYIQSVNNVTRDNLQLVGISAMFLACKYEEIYPPELDDFVYITDSAYTKSDIINMEKDILKTLSFNLGRPISLTFLRRYSKAARSQALHHAYAKYFIELVLMDYTLCHVNPSIIAAVAMFISHCIVNETKTVKPELWTPTVAYYSTYRFSDFEMYIPRIAKNIKQASELKLKAITKKYSDSKLQSVSLHPSVQPNSEILEKLCNHSCK